MSTEVPVEKNGSIRSVNQRLARRVLREGKADPKSPYANRFVGIANGEIAAVSDSLTDVSRRLRKAEPDNTRCVIVDLVGDYDRAYEV